MTIKILCLILFAAGCVVGIFLYRSTRETRELKAQRKGLWKRVEDLRAELRTHIFTDGKVELTLQEKRIVLNALEDDAYKDRITTPSTKKFIRDLYREVRGKFKDGIKRECRGL